jgi:diaminopimelate decarboxylase
VFELGRYLVADAGLYVARVISSKTSRGKSFVVVDGGLHHHLAAAGTFGAGLRSNFPLRNLSRAPKGALQRRRTLLQPHGPAGYRRGTAATRAWRPDRRAEVDSYGLTASPLLFLGRATPAELVRSRGEIILGRRSRSILDFN